LELFVDRDSISWGEEWRERIDSFLTQTTFLVPIITPRYFTRSECRRELLEFVAKAKSLGVEKLLLPILYIEVKGLSVDSPDEAVTLIARTQYVDWHTNRLLEPGSREYRTAVNALALRLLEIARSVAETQLSQELKLNAEEDVEGDGLYGISEIIEKITELLPDWLDVVLGEQVNDAQVSATWQEYSKKIAKLRSTHAPPSAILSAHIRMTKELLPLAERGQNDARTYLTRSVQLDPLVSALARLVAEHPENFGLATPVREAIDEAMAVIRREEEGLKAGYRNINDAIAKMKHLGRAFQQCNTLLNSKWQAADEGNAIVRRWDAELINPE
jgi:TIR domain